MTSDFECWENEETGLRTEIPSQNSGDLGVYQTKLVGFEPTGRIVAHYDYRPTFLIHLMIFHLQTGMPIPNRCDWNKKFFNGKFPIKEGRTFFDLFRIKQHAEAGNLLKILRDTEFDEGDKAISIPQSYSPEVKLYPLIDQNGNLVYIKIPERKKEIILGREDVSRAFEVVRAHMLENIRGQREDLGKIYSKFPFEAYERARTEEK